MELPTYDIIASLPFVISYRFSEAPYATRWTPFHFHIVEEAYKEERIGSEQKHHQEHLEGASLSKLLPYTS